MYLIVTHIPVYLQGRRYYADVSWQRSLALARDWLARPFGDFTLLSPSLPLSAVNPAVMKLVPIGENDGIRVVPSFDLRCRARQFWVHQRQQWVADVRKELAKAKVLHVSASDVFRPLAFLAHAAGVRSDVTTVLVGPDMDPHATLPPNLKGKLACAAFDLFMHRAMRHSDLVLLKEGLVFDRYAKGATNVKAFCHSLHRDADVIGEGQLEQRLASLGRDRPLKAAYAGRFVARKGLSDAIAAVAAARRLGVPVEYHLFGSGPVEGALRRKAADLGVADAVHFHGFVEYGPQFIARLAEFDLLLFMPTEEDTPRMLYDAMAAGLPLVGSNIPFLRHRVQADQIGVLVDIHDSTAAAAHLQHFHAEPLHLAQLARAARAAGHRHTIERWYGRRSEWTLGAFARHSAAHPALRPDAALASHSSPPLPSR
jgi:glycosyltransferase involved in cell wall biosynthesis